jgi:uncharacterized YccA/Bax inhibitor family protein
MRTSNPAMQVFVNPQTWTTTASSTMTLRGTIIASFILTAICATGASITWGFMAGGTPAAAMPWLLGGVAGSAIAGLVLFFSPRTAPFVAPFYAAGQGLVLGCLSYLIPFAFPHKTGFDPSGVVIQAMLLTFGILFAMLAAYSVGLVRIGGTAAKVIMVAMGGVCIYYLASILLPLMGVSVVRLDYAGGMWGIGFSLFVIVLASLNLVMDFQFIEAGVMNKAPKYMEWYGAYGLLVTLVWLYIETLKLMAKLQRRD